MSAATRRSRVWRMTGLPRRSSKSLGVPIRRERPAASTMAAITKASKQKAPRKQIRGARKNRLPSLLGGRRLDCPLGEDLEQVLLVLLRALEVWLDIDAIRALLRRRLDRCRVGSLARDGGLDALRPHGLAARPRDSDAGLGDLAAVHRKHRRHADHGE